MTGSDKLAWGILGTGNIARQFAAGVSTSRRGTLRAVGSRTQENAAAFAAKFHVQTAYGSYEELLADASVQAIYVSLPNTLHFDWTLRALRAGKHVLCEKPFAVDFAQAEQMFDLADEMELTLVEAFMYRSHPVTDAVMRAVREGKIGELRLIRTSFCYRTTRIAGNVRFDPALAGGGLMDVGCYCINFSRLFAGQEPAACHAIARLHESGVDDMAAGMMLFPNGIVASFTCGMSAQADNTAYLCGTEGFIEMPVPWKPPREQATWVLARGTPPRMDAPGVAAPPPAPSPRQTFTVDAPADLYGCEADDFAATVLDGQPPRLTPQDTLGNMRVLDAMRKQIGLEF